jgi:beta-glucosidase
VAGPITAQRFADYAGLVARELGDDVGMWITINEPQVVAHQGYGSGAHAPGKTDNDLAAAATHHLLLGHGLAMQAVRSAQPAPAPIGLSLDLHPIRAAEPEAAELAAEVDAEQNRIFLDPVLHGSYPHAARRHMLPPEHLIEDGDMSLISARIDFVGLNYCSPYYVRYGDGDDLRRGEIPIRYRPGVVNYHPPDLPRTVMDWIVEPGSRYDALRGLDRESGGLPVYITENGCAADAYVTPEGVVNDFERIAYLEGHLRAAWRAIQDGVNLAGYFHWSLMDNFEWAHRYRRRFGLYFVDFGTQRRLPKRSAAFYSNIARTNALAPENDLFYERAVAGRRRSEPQVSPA